MERCFTFLYEIRHWYNIDNFCLAKSSRFAHINEIVPMFRCLWRLMAFAFFDNYPIDVNRIDRDKILTTFASSRIYHMTEIFPIISWLWLHMASMGFCPCWQLSRRCQLHQMNQISLLCAYWQVITSQSPLTVFLQLDCLLSHEWMFKPYEVGRN